MAISDTEFVTEQRRQVRKAHDRIEAVITAQNLPCTGSSAAERARQFLTVVMGVAVQAAFDAKAWPAKRQRACIAHQTG